MPDFKVFTQTQNDRENDAFYESAGDYDITIHDGFKDTFGYEWLVEARSERDLVNWIERTGNTWAYDDDYYPA